MSGAVLLPPKLLLQDAQNVLNRAFHGPFGVLGSILAGDGRPSRQMHFNRAAGVRAALRTVHVFQIHLNPAEAVPESRSERRFDIGPDGLGKLFAVLKVVVRSHLENHGLLPECVFWLLIEAGDATDVPVKAEQAGKLSRP